MGQYCSKCGRKIGIFTGVQSGGMQTFFEGNKKVSKPVCRDCMNYFMKYLEERIDNLPTIEMVQKTVEEILVNYGISKNPVEKYESKIVNSKGEVIRLSDIGFSCQPIGSGEWLMRKKTIGANRMFNI